MTDGKLFLSLAAEALNVSVLPRGAGLDEQRPEPLWLLPRLDRVARKLRGIVAPQALRTASQQEPLLKDPQDLAARDIEKSSCLCGQTMLYDI